MKKEESLRERFDSTGRSLAKYARAYGLDSQILKGVLSEELKGARNRKGVSKVRLCILRLQEDGLWRGALPWDEQKAA